MKRYAVWSTACLLATALLLVFRSEVQSQQLLPDQIDYFDVQIRWGEDEEDSLKSRWSASSSVTTTVRTTLLFGTIETFSLHTITPLGHTAIYQGQGPESTVSGFQFSNPASNLPFIRSDYTISCHPGPQFQLRREVHSGTLQMEIVHLEIENSAVQPLYLEVNHDSVVELPQGERYTATFLETSGSVQVSRDLDGLESCASLSWDWRLLAEPHAPSALYLPLVEQQSLVKRR